MAPARQIPAIATCGARLFWLLMAVAHVPAWLASATALTAEGAPALVRLALLSVSLLYFVLKLADVPWLRLPRTARGRLVVAAIFLLLHADLVRRYGANEATYEFVPLAAVTWCVGAGALGALVAMSRRRGPRPTATVAIDLLVRQLHAWLARSELWHLLPAQIRSAPRVDRAPPA